MKAKGILGGVSALAALSLFLLALSPQAASEQKPNESAKPHWEVLYQEDFESLPDFDSPAWQPDTYPDDGPFSDNGVYFQNRGVKPPVAYRISQAFGQEGWLTIESYTRHPKTPLNQLASIVEDPSGRRNNRVLRLKSLRHTDATVIRPSRPLPERYRVSLRVGYADWGDGLGGKNGYDGDEDLGPWLKAKASKGNGYYWLAILDAPPRPHNSVYIHHHRKVVVDSDNHYPVWMEIFDGEKFVPSGRHPIMMFALDGRGYTHPLVGKPFLSYSAGRWQPSGEIRAVDSYKDEIWYTVSIMRDAERYTIEISGDFQYGGARSYKGEISPADNCIWHYNRPGEEARGECIDEGTTPELPGFPLWPAGRGWPDYFMFGDPHANSYEGQVHYDDLRLEVWKD